MQWNGNEWMWTAFNLNFNSKTNLLFPLSLSSPHTISSISSGSNSWFSFGSISSVMVKAFCSSLAGYASFYFSPEATISSTCVLNLVFRLFYTSMTLSFGFSALLYSFVFDNFPMFLCFSPPISLSLSFLFLFHSLRLSGSISKCSLFRFVSVSIECCQLVQQQLNTARTMLAYTIHPDRTDKICHLYS